MTYNAKPAPAFILLITRVLNLHDDGHMIVHVLIDIAQEARRDDAHPAKRDADQIDILVALGKGHLPGSHDDFPRCLVARDAGDQSDFVEEGGAREGDGRHDGLWVRDAEFEFHGATNVVDCIGGEFGDEDVVVGCVADGAADDADGQGEGCDGGDQVLKGRVSCGERMEYGNGVETYVWANDGRDDGSWDDDAADSETGEDKETPGSVERVGFQTSKSADACGIFLN